MALNPQKLFYSALREEPDGTGAESAIPPQPAL